MVRHLQPWRPCPRVFPHDRDSISRGVASLIRQRSISSSNCHSQHLLRSPQRRHYLCPSLNSLRLQRSNNGRASSGGPPKPYNDAALSQMQFRSLSKVSARRQAQQAAQVQEEGEMAVSPIPSNGVDGRQDAGNEEARKPPGVRALPVEIDARALAPMIETLQDARRLGLPDTAQTYPSAVPEPERNLWPTDPRRLEKFSKELADEWHAKRHNPTANFRRSHEERLRLPVMAEDIQQKILGALRNSDVLIVRANTGSGKTTQIPQIILDQALQEGRGASCNIAITQPRRISATSVAKRVASERDEPLGESVGFKVRFSNFSPRKKGSLLYCTAGTLLTNLRTREDMSTNYSHIILDEVHERSMVTDCALTLLRDLIRIRKAQRQPYPKIVLMSATVESGLFLDYFQEPHNGVTLRTTAMSIEGRMFPVKTNYLTDFLPEIEADSKTDPWIQSCLEGTKKDQSTKDHIQEELRFAAAPPEKEKASTEPEEEKDNEELDQDTETDIDPISEHDSAVTDNSTADLQMSPIGLVAASVVHVLQKSTHGDILVFLVGLGDIDKAAEVLTKHPRLGKEFEAKQTLRIFKLHSSLSDMNDEVFEPVPDGCRRVVLATNIAETSITLPAVEHVIDAGRVRQRHYDQQSRMDTFPSVWISKSNRQQRQGRAGRVRPGTYYGLFTRERADSFVETTDPELTRMDLAEPCLDLKAAPASADVREFFKRAPSPPQPVAVDTAISYLQKLGALTAEEEMTPLGRLLANIPIHPSMMRAVLLGILFQCLEPMLIIACYNFDAPLVASHLEGATVVGSKRLFAANSESDLLAYVNAFKEYEAAVQAGDAETIQHLEQDRHVRGRAFAEMSKVARQICQELSHAGLLPYPAIERSVFESIPPALNKNAGCIPLLKALSMNLFDSDVALRKGRSPRFFHAVNNTRSMLNHRSVNYGRSLAMMTTPRKVRKPTDLMTYVSRRQDTDSPNMSWLVDTSMITPLMGAIFGRTLNETTSGLLLNQWIEMQIGVTESTVDPSLATRVLLEFRKAFERFCILAFTDLEEAARQAESGWSVIKRHKADSLMANIRQDMFPRKRPQKNFITRELRDVFVKGVLKVLEADQQAAEEVFARDAIEAEERERKAEAEKKLKVSSKERLEQGAAPEEESV